MRHFHTAVIERREPFQGAFAVQPHEAAWATEAIYFVRIEAVEGSGATGTVRVHAQLSVDGTRWLDEGSSLDLAAEPGDAFLRLRHFGGWLRLRGEMDDDVRCTLTVHLALKE